MNAINDTIPMKPVYGAQGAFVADFGTAAKDAGAAVDFTVGNGRWAMHGGGSGRRNDDVDTPEGTIANTQSRGGFGNVGVAWTGARAFAGASYGYDDTKYGIPFVEEGMVELTPRRHMFGLKAGASELGGLLEGYRVDFASRRYKHEELVGGEVGTSFGNDTDETQPAAASPTGRPTLWNDRRLLSESVVHGDRRGSAVAASQRKGVRRLLLRGADVAPRNVPVRRAGEPRNVRPRGGPPVQDFTDTSGSVGLLFRPAAAHDKLTIAISLARAARNPALEELYFFGPHPGNFAFEIGNPDLEIGKGAGFDVALRWRATRISGEFSYFYNRINDYIFRNPISEEEFDERFGHEEERRRGGARRVPVHRIRRGRQPAPGCRRAYGHPARGRFWS